MKISFIIIGLICISGVIHGLPRKCYNLENQLIDSELTENDYDFDDIDHKVVKKSIESSSKLNSIGNEEHNEEPCRLSLPNIVIPGYDESETTYSEGKVEETPLSHGSQLDDQYLPPLELSLYELRYYSQDPEDNRIPYKVPYDFMSPFPPVRSLPPVYTTKIYETLPNELNIDEHVYSESSWNYPNVRAVRNEDLVAELEKEADIPNILPTMPFPYMRDAAPRYETPYHQQYVAIFPVDSSDCSLPFLFACNPQMFLGELSKSYIDSQYTPSAYRDDSNDMQ